MDLRILTSQQEQQNLNVNHGDAYILTFNAKKRKRKKNKINKLKSI